MKWQHYGEVIFCLSLHTFDIANQRFLMRWWFRTKYCAPIRYGWNAMGGACSTYGERNAVYRILVGKREGKRPLGRRGRHCHDHKSLQITRVFNKNNPIHILTFFPLLSILILPFHLRLWLPNSYFPSESSTKILCQHSSPMCATCPLHLNVHNLISLTIFCVGYNFWSSIYSN